MFNLNLDRLILPVVLILVGVVTFYFGYIKPMNELYELRSAKHDKAIVTSIKKIDRENFEAKYKDEKPKPIERKPYEELNISIGKHTYIVN